MPPVPRSLQLADTSRFRRISLPVLAADAVDFTRDIAPLLAGRCGACHGPEKQKNGLRLDNGAAVARDVDLRSDAWATRVAQARRRLLADGYNVEVINAGISGETTSGALSRVNWVLGLEPDIVILATGGNDGLRGIAPELTERNLDQLVTTFQDVGVTVLLAGMEMVENMGEEYTSAFRAIYPTVSAAHEDTTLKGRGRHDACVLPRAVPIVEAMALLVITDHLLRQRGQCGL